MRVKTTGSKKHSTFEDIQGQSFMAILEQKLRGLKKTRVLKDSRKTISLKQLDVDMAFLSGILQSGEYGIDADLFDTETMQTHQRMRKQKHSEVYPFFFLFDLPDKQDYGYAILQEFRGRGIKSILHGMLNDLLEKLDLTVSMNPIFSPKLFEMLETSRLVKLRFIRRTVPKDIADLVHEEKPEEITEERIIRARPKERIRITKDFKRILRNAISDKSEGYYVILDEKYDMVKAEIRKGESTKTLTFGPEHKLRESMPLEKNLDLVGGFPTYEYLVSNAKEYLADIKAQGLGG